MTTENPTDLIAYNKLVATSTYDRIVENFRAGKDLQGHRVQPLIYSP